MNLHDTGLFAMASFVLNITPGNDFLYVASRSMGQGIKAGIVSALGIMAGCMVHIGLAMAGLSALIAGSAMAFDIIKYLGALYLLYLGIRSFISKQAEFRPGSKLPLASYGMLLRQGILTNVLNPKVALFFLSFLPPFVHPADGHTGWQVFLLGSWFNFSGTVVNICVAILFGKIGYRLSGSSGFFRWQPGITGLLLMGLGIRVALFTRK